MKYITTEDAVNSKPAARRGRKAMSPPRIVRLPLQNGKLLVKIIFGGKKMKKVLSILLVLTLLMGVSSGFVFAAEVLPDVQDFEAEFMAAPAVAGLLLKAAGVDNRYGQGKNGGNFIKDIAQHMGPGTDFDGVAKEDELAYECAIAAFLNNTANGESYPAGVTCSGCGVFDPIASKATSTDNENGTLTLEITVVDLCGNGISGLDPLSDFYVTDFEIAGTFYFGTGSIPTSSALEWSEVDGVYTVTLLRNRFSSRPTGY